MTDSLILGLFEKPCLVDDEHAARLIPEVREYIVPQIVADPAGIPASDSQQALHTLRIGIADRLGELPATLAFDAVEQAVSIAPQPLAHFRADKAVSDALIEIGEHVGPLLDGNDRGTSACCHTPSSAWQRRAARSLAK